MLQPTDLAPGYRVNRSPLLIFLGATLSLMLALSCKLTHSEPIKARSVASALIPVIPSVLVAPSASTAPLSPPALSSFTTGFGPVPDRVSNIKLAAGKLNGFVIEPGATMSFNEVVGIRSKKNGYKEAPMIFEGRKMNETGGGVCQVSSTLHAASVHGHFTIKERYPHSLVSHYIHAGYDATVAFPESCEIPDATCGKIDLRITNPFEAPVTVRTEVTDVHGGGQLTVRLEGIATDCTHSVSYWKKPLDQGVRRMVRSSKILDPKYVKKAQESAKGLVIWSSVIWKCPGKPDEPVRWFSRYPPVDEVWEVGWKRPRDSNPPWESSPDQEGAP